MIDLGIIIGLLPFGLLCLVLLCKFIRSMIEYHQPKSCTLFDRGMLCTMIPCISISHVEIPSLCQDVIDIINDYMRLPTYTQILEWMHEMLIGDTIWVSITVNDFRLQCDWVLKFKYTEKNAFLFKCKNDVVKYALYTEPIDHINSNDPIKYISFTLTRKIKKRCKLWMNRSFMQNEYAFLRIHRKYNNSRTLELPDISIVCIV